MCGIVGAASHRNIVPVLVQGLQRLEYRGYDSCGVAVHAGGLTRARTTSRVADLVTQVREDHVEGLTGGRWVLLDFVDFVIHLFHPETRSFYQLERLWDDAPELLISST